MTGKSFLVESCSVNKELTSIYWHDKEIKARGHMVCSGGDYRFLVYFLDDKKNLPDPEFIKVYKLGVVFEPFSKMEDYVKMSEEKAPLYAYLNYEKPELNCITINKPVRKLVYF
ncbi:hypothetical protein [Abyssalbus ytuae]|uniref:Uncharacterized protein n=1 Tax=Abyssalbus ytuae TaxID=2926907 RepID=A0A9E7D2U7_9FLAO|nr:hypothetical protein [Abyssalbus ytuae]UOB18548.1 hypothetical protein MQE35_04485 [Abyssalbus ytuae]